MISNSVGSLPYGMRDVPYGYPNSVGLRFRVGDDEYFRVGFANERVFRSLAWRVVEGKLVKGEVEMTETEHDNWLAQGLRLAPGKEPGYFYSTEPVSFESAYMMALGYHGFK